MGHVGCFLRLTPGPRAYVSPSTSIISFRFSGTFISAARSSLAMELGRPTSSAFTTL